LPAASDERHALFMFAVTEAKAALICAAFNEGGERVVSKPLPMDGTAAWLVGLRVLLVEDEMMQAMMVEGGLRDVGCVVVGMAATLGKALILARSAAIDVAMLDVNLGGQRVYEAAVVLQARGIPFVFVTGSSAAELGEQFHDIGVVQKPFLMATLVTALRAACGRARCDLH
jgi:CheY-like chemotaxis protein